MKSTKSKKNPYSRMTIKELKTLAEHGDAEAQFKLGNRYKQGKGVGKKLLAGGGMVHESGGTRKQKGEKDAQGLLQIIHHPENTMAHREAGGQ